MKDWPIPGPDGPYLTAGEVVAFCRMSSERQLERLVAELRFPPGITFGGRGPTVWKTVDVATWLWLASSTPSLFGCLDDGDNDPPTVPKRRTKEKNDEP